MLNNIFSVLDQHQQRLNFGRGFESCVWQNLGALDDPTD
jgi:hypothetical protein